MMSTEIQMMYEEYRIECDWEGKTPKSFWEWWYSFKRD